MLIRPANFEGINGYHEGIGHTNFCWRWFSKNGEQYRAVTIEDDQNAAANAVSKGIRPRDLHGINGYHENLGHAYFCWRWFNNGKTDYRLVTLEDGEHETHGSSSIKPRELHGVNGFHADADHLNFCWRWFEHGNGKNYRVLTLE